LAGVDFDFVLVAGFTDDFQGDIAFFSDFETLAAGDFVVLNSFVDGFENLLLIHNYGAFLVLNNMPTGY